MLKIFVIFFILTGIVNSQTRPGGGPDDEEMTFKKMEKEVWVSSLMGISNTVTRNFSQCDIKQKRPDQFNIIEIYELINNLFMEEAVSSMYRPMKIIPECRVSKISCLLKGAELDFHKFTVSEFSKPYLMNKFKKKADEAEAILNFFKLVAPSHVNLGPLHQE